MEDEKCHNKSPTKGCKQMKKWRYCEKCHKPVVVEVYRQPLVALIGCPDEIDVDVDKELDDRMYEHQLHLCPSCKFEFATCRGDPVFGQCVGKDNVVECAIYLPKAEDKKCHTKSPKMS